MHTSPLIDRARQLAAKAHEHQLRKAAAVPYMVHLESVVTTLQQHGYHDDHQLSAAYLHDVLEDQPQYADEVRRSMPAEVVALIECLTERKFDAKGDKRPKRQRFSELLSRLAGGDDIARRALPISCADKLDNTLSLIEAERTGRRLLLRLNTRPGEHKTQLAALRQLYESEVSSSLLQAFDDAARELESTIAAWLPGRAVMLAAEVHLGQFDAAGDPFILRPMRLAARARTNAERVVALLNRVLEDPTWTLDELRREGFSEEVLEAISSLTRAPEESDEASLALVASHRLAMRVKLLDLSDSIERLSATAASPGEHARLAELRRAHAQLTRESAKRSLWVELDQNSQRALRDFCTLPVVRSDHITLAHRVTPEEPDTTSLPHGHRVGDTVEAVAVALCSDGRVQAAIVELGGTTRRPRDGGILHVTMSRIEAASSNESNLMLQTAEQTPCRISLRGVVRWVDA